MNFTMRLFQHREIWYVEMDGGKRRSLKTRDKAEARRIFAQIKKEWLAGKLSYLTGQCQKTLGEFADEYLKWAEPIHPRSTFRANRLAINKLIYHAGRNIHLDRITRKHMDVMVSAGKLKGLSTASLNNYLRHSRSVLNKAVEWGYIQSNPLKDAKEIRLEPRPPEFMDKKDIPRFLASIKDVDLRRIVVAYLATGRRRSELLNLTWEDVDEENGRYRIVGKGSRTQWHPINGMLQAVFDSIDGERCSRVFDRWAHPDTLSHLVKRSLFQAGIGHLHLHHLRHTFASMKAMEGKTIQEIQALLGHKDIKATMIYSHLSDEHIRKVSEVNFGPVNLSD
jgi:integrase